jgi:YD repeat-containing protein
VRHALVAVSPSTPDSTKTGAITTRWKFDALGRTVAEIAPDSANASVAAAAHDAGFSLATPRDSTVYDAAGNAVRVLSRRGKWTAMRYDALGRLTRRMTDSVSYPVSADTVLIPGTVANRDIWYFPLFSPGLDGTPSDTLYRQPVRIAGDTATFAYDAAGNLLQAENADAKVHRSYYPGGLLQRDSLYVRNYAGGSFGHAYGITHTYDLEGRLVRNDNPAQLAAADPTWASHAYGSDPVTGALASVSNAVGSVAGFVYDADGRLRSTDLGSTVETEGYDADGRMAWERRVANTGPLLQRDTFAYDVRGKRTGCGRWRTAR